MFFCAFMLSIVFSCVLLLLWNVFAESDVKQNESDKLPSVFANFLRATLSTN